MGDRRLLTPILENVLVFGPEHPLTGFWGTCEAGVFTLHLLPLLTLLHLPFEILSSKSEDEKSGVFLSEFQGPNAEEERSCPRSLMHLVLTFSYAGTPVKPVPGLSLLAA